MSGLTAESVLRNIPRGLCMHPDDPAWLSCRFCLRNGRRLMLPNEVGVTNHFLKSRHAPIETEPTEASPGRQSMWSTQNQAAADQPPPEPVQDAPPRWIPARYLGLDCRPSPRSSGGALWDTQDEVATAGLPSCQKLHPSRLPHPRPKPLRHLPPALPIRRAQSIHRLLRHHPFAFPAHVGSHRNG